MSKKIGPVNPTEAKNETATDDKTAGRKTAAGKFKGRKTAAGKLGHRKSAAGKYHP